MKNRFPFVLIAALTGGSLPFTRPADSVAFAQTPVSVPTVAAPQTVSAPAALRVAIYDHSKGDAKAPPALMRFLTKEAGFVCTRVRPEDIASGCLKEYDVLIMPGGSGSLQAQKLGETGRENIRTWVKNGGGYVGICAGAYLATTYYPWSLNILNARVVDREHWARGTGQVKVEFTPEGKTALHAPEGEAEIYYGQGPLLAPDTKAEPAPFETLARYKSEIAKKGAPSGVMVGTTAMARGTFGQGRVICFSPHAEVKDGPNYLTLAGVRWAGKQEALSTPRKE